MNKCLANKLNVLESWKPSGRPKNILGALALRYLPFFLVPTENYFIS